MFGWLPIRVSAEGTWTAATGSRLVDDAANTFARIALSVIHGVEVTFNVELPVSMVPYKDRVAAAR